MAQITITTLVDDLDGIDVGTNSGQTIRFGVDGRGHQIDLSDDNADAFLEASQPYVEAGGRIAPTRTRRRCL